MSARFRVHNFKYFDVFLTLFIASLLTANIIAVKIVSIGPLLIPAAVIIFPISYIVGDVLTEVYGLEKARRAIWLGFGANLLMVLAIAAAQRLPTAPFWDAQMAYERILGFTPRLLAASFVGYLIGEFSNSYVMVWVRTLTEGRWLWVRTISSTIIGQGLDSFAFITIAFFGTMPATDLVIGIITQWLFKVVYEALATPITYGVITWLKRAEDVYSPPQNDRASPGTTVSVIEGESA